MVIINIKPNDVVDNVISPIMEQPRNAPPPARIITDGILANNNEIPTEKRPASSQPTSPNTDDDGVDGVPIVM